MVERRLKRIYAGMKSRCHSNATKDYARYGAKGITICDEWLQDRASFVEWSLRNGYSDSLTIDRIDPTKGYSPDNCRWATAHQQSLNKTTSRFITINGVTKNLSEWEHCSGISSQAILFRIKCGWSTDRLLDPVAETIIFYGEEKTFGQLGKESGLNHKTIRRRYHAGWDEKDLLLPLSKKKYADRGDRLGAC